MLLIKGNFCLHVYALFKMKTNYLIPQTCYSVNSFFFSILLYCFFFSSCKILFGLLSRNLQIDNMLNCKLCCSFDVVAYCKYLMKKNLKHLFALPSKQACTEGGCRLGPPASATTEESAPGGVSPPIVTSPSPSQFNVKWDPPARPNGINIILMKIIRLKGLKFRSNGNRSLQFLLHHFITIS